ncbi:hypothetical protein [Vibrio mediterranei]|uniref:Uncharacterized protein n=1 Tax=Vibrio mediterranei TaxID=689 RepID=A0ABX5DA08_9VIBR|nr:hypothetical protein [Vibrio mediterranei]PCD85643.1 hypothetical protein COR52_25790 [Vibrio mediterranei]PRQ66522.1 hypothetical protein COR51_16445 [Vibrio mediterranei]
METDNTFEQDVALALRLNIIHPNTLANASPAFVQYWQRVREEVQKRKHLSAKGETDVNLNRATLKC